jgi:hypothetical protein
MRRLQLLLAIFLTLPMLAWAVDDIPPDLEPLQEVPPPPVVQDGAAVDEPEVTIIQKDGETIEEYRINGELYMMKITPKNGVPYYLQKEDQHVAGQGSMVHRHR